MPLCLRFFEKIVERQRYFIAGRCLIMQSRFKAFYLPGQPAFRFCTPYRNFILPQRKGCQCGLLPVGKQFSCPGADLFGSSLIVAGCQQLRQLAERLVRTIIFLPCEEDLGLFPARRGIFRGDGKHLLDDFQDLGQLAAFFIIGTGNAIFGEGITAKTLFFVEGSKGKSNLDGVAGDFLNLFIDRYRLEEITVVSVKFADGLIFSYCLFLASRTYQEFCEALPMADLLGIEGDNLLIILDGTVQLPFEDEFLRAFQKFIFFRSQMNPHL